MMLSGAPYSLVVARNGKPLSPTEWESEKSRYADAVRAVNAESKEQRSQRLAAYQTERMRNQRLLEEFTQAMRFDLVGKATLMSHQTYVLRASPKPGYRAKSRETKILTGMVGTLWVDEQSLRWVRVQAEVTRSVIIQGFVATVEPGTKFEMEESPIAAGVWLASHFSMNATAKVLLLFRRSMGKDELYFHHQPTGTLDPESCLQPNGADLDRKLP